MAQWDGRRQQTNEPADGRGSPNPHRPRVMINDQILLEIARKVGDWMLLAVTLGFDRADILIFTRNNPQDTVFQTYNMLIEWRRKQPPDVNRTEVLCEAFESATVGRRDLAIKLRELMLSSQQSGQPSVGTSDYRASTSQEPITQGAVSQTPECSSQEKMKPDSPAQAAANCCEGELKAHYKSTGSYVEMIPWIEDDKRHFKNIYTKLQLAKDSKDTYRLEKKDFETGSLKGYILESYEDIFFMKTEGGELIRIAVLVGLPGRGRSTLFGKMAYDWADDCSKVIQKKYKLVILLKMHALQQSSDLVDAIFDQVLAEDTHIEKRALELYITANSDKVLILLDGFDELMATSVCRSPIGSILKILNRKMCRDCTVLVSTRPSHVDRLITKDLVQKPFTHVMVLGFSDEDVVKYVNRFYSDETDKHEPKGLLDRIKSSNVLTNLAESPMLLLLMCLLWREDSTLPETMTLLYRKAFQFIFERKKDISSELSAVVKIGKIGLCGLLCPNQELAFNEREFGEGVLKMAIEAGILTRQRVLKDLQTHNSVQFIHKTFQEFCAAQYMQCLFEVDTQEFMKILNEIVSKGPQDFDYLLRFCCGDNEACTNAILTVFLKETFQETLSCDSMEGKLALHCYFESRLKHLPEEFIQAFVTDHVLISSFNDDCLNSFMHFLKGVTNQTKNTDNGHLAKVRNLSIINCKLSRFSEDLAYSLHEMTKLQSLVLINCSLPVNSVGHICSSLKRATSLTSLDLTGSTLIGPDAVWSTYLKHLKHIQKLMMSSCHVTGEDASHFPQFLKCLPNLVELDLSNNTDLRGSAALWSIPQLKQLKHLQKLDFHNSALTCKDVKYIGRSLSDLPDLVELNLSQNQALGGRAAEWSVDFWQLKHLKRLVLYDCKLTSEDLKHVAESLPNLVEVDLSGNQDLSGKAALWSIPVQQLKCLTKLSLRNCKLTGDDVKHVAESLSDLPDLTKLDLSHNSDLGGPVISWSKQLKQFKHLQKVNLGQCNLEGEDMKYIVESLSSLPNLVVLKLTCNRRLGGTADLWSVQLTQLKKLKKLSLDGCLLTGMDMQYLAESLSDLPDLTELSLSRNKKLGGTASSWSDQLGQLRHLQSLNLNSCSLTDRDVEHLAEPLRALPNLTELDLCVGFEVGHFLRGSVGLEYVCDCMDRRRGLELAQPCPHQQQSLQAQQPEEDLSRAGACQLQ